MDPRAILLTAFAMPFAGVVILAIINRRTLAGDRTDDLSAEGADEGAWGVVQHAQPITHRERNDHA